jgi:hypothetical protein
MRRQPDKPCVAEELDGNCILLRNATKQLEKTLWRRMWSPKDIFNGCCQEHCAVIMFAIIFADIYIFDAHCTLTLVKLLKDM